MATTHWLGAGLSSVPGIRRLANSERKLTLWNRTLAKAEAALAGLTSTATAEKLEWDTLKAEVSAGDVLVSMLPATMHLDVAQICLDRGAHFVSSSYVSPEMKKLDSQARERQLCFINECGLDPGLDHLMAHVLVNEYRNSDCFSADNEHHFRSYCGGFPKVPNDFKYKFSWSPLGVLRALRSPAKWTDGGQVQETETPWKSLKNYSARLPGGEETFQSYPNRDSLPFKAEYGFGSDWNIQEFVRGTLRLDGWAEAWGEIFELVESAEGESGQKALADKSDELWQNFQYDSGEPDRVVLSVELQVNKNDSAIWHQTYCLDACGNENGSAMSRLVSLPVSIAVESVLNGGVQQGVSAAIKDVESVSRWLQELTTLGEKFERITIV